jgi:hypothetical protein
MLSTVSSSDFTTVFEHTVNTALLGSIVEFNRCSANTCLYFDEETYVIWLLVTGDREPLKWTMKVFASIDGVLSSQSIEATFVIDVLSCVINSVSVETSELVEYVLGSELAIYSLPRYTQEPACGYEPTSVVEYFLTPVEGFNGKGVFFSAKGVAILLETDMNYILAEAVMVWDITATFPGSITVTGGQFAVKFVKGLVDEPPGLEKEPSINKPIPCLDS